MSSPLTHHRARSDRPPTRRARRRAATVAATVAALVLAGAAPALATTDDPLDQTVEQDEEIGDEQVVLEHGHVDIGPRIVDDEWQLLARDDSTAPPVWRYLEDMVFHLPDQSILPAPEDEQFGFIDAEPGQDVYVIPQTEDYEVPWLGWNSQDPDVVAMLARGMTLRLHGVEGPGQFTLFLQSGNFDDAQLLWSSDDTSEPQDIWADTNSHVHANWVFTEPGVYLLDVEVLGELSDGTTGSHRDTLRFAVGDSTDPQQAFGAVEVPTDESDLPAETAASAPAADQPPVEDPDDGSAVPIAALAIGAAALLLVAVAVLRSLKSRRDRLVAEEETR